MDSICSSNTIKKGRRNYKCIYDPELDFQGLKKSKHAIFQYEDDITSTSVLPLQDPRIDKANYEKNFSKGKFLYKRRLHIVEYKVVLMSILLDQSLLQKYLSLSYLL
jgi:hypothetical protein